ncbi:MAG TPA: DUF4129 domain-containing protein [Anaerolineae bacterium]|nr:DUF4129 domain-containing protein [Anaerolineae bacterium]
MQATTLKTTEMMEGKRSRELPGGWFTFACLLLLVMTIAWAVSAARWAEGLEVLQWIGLAGLLLGTAMAVSSWGEGFMQIQGLITGTAVVLHLVSGLIKGDYTTSQRVFFLFERLYVWGLKVISGESSRDNLIFTLEVGLLFWWMTYLGAWAVFHQRRPWRAVIPMGLVLLINLYYGPPKLSPFLVLFVACALLLVTRSNLADQEKEWRATGIRYPLDISLDFLRDGFVFTVLVILVAWVAPRVPIGDQVDRLIEPLQTPWERVKEEWNRLFSELNYQPVAAVAVFGHSLALGGPRVLGDRIVMEVSAPAGRYLRAITYDTYTGDGWLATGLDKTRLSPGEVLPVPRYALRRTVTQTVRVALPIGNLLFASPQPVRVELEADAEVRRLPKEAVPPTPESGPELRARTESPLEIAVLYSGRRLQKGSSYTVVSSLSEADVESLRSAGEDYPPYITEQYLQLPASLPQRVVDLAEEITSPYDNAYDRATALEHFLRTFKYDESIEGPRAGQDGVDYFLFDVRRGYCTYYASAMAVMARVVGIPARLASGYAEGEYVEELHAFQVREEDAHTWVEVYFPRYGWVEFEPTASQPAIVRPTRTPEDPSGSESSSSSDRAGEGRFGPDEFFPEENPPFPQPTGFATIPEHVRYGLVALVLIVVLALMGFVFIRRTPQAEDILVPRIYERLLRWAARLGLARRESQTAYEHAHVLAHAMPESADPIYHLTELYVQREFSPRPVPRKEVQAAEHDWRVLQPVLVRRWLRRLLVSLVR